MNIQQAHAEHIERCRAAGKTIITYRIIACGHWHESIAAPAGERWETVAMCIQCGKPYLKITKGSTIITWTFTDITREME